MLGRGLSLVDFDDREWKINQLLFVDDMALVADSLKKLCRLVEEFGQVCKWRYACTVPSPNLLYPVCF